MSRRRSARIAVAMCVAAACALAIGVPIGSADAGGNASCVGFEASSISPPASSEEVPGGAPELVAFLKSEFGKAGPVVSSIAKLHEGSHAACDEAIEE